MKFLTSLLAFAATFALISSAPVVTKSGPTAVCYVEVNSNSIKNVGRYTLADGSNTFDIANIFAANIKWNGKAAYIFNNPNVQAVLDDAKNQIKPLQDQGIKVLLSILGGGERAGIANFASQADAGAFADLITAEITKHSLDGVDLDDEYVDYGTSGVPPANDQSIRWLVSALRTKMPNKLITFYNIGAAAKSLASAPASVGSRLSYTYNPYYGSYQPPTIPGLRKAQVSPAAVDLTQTSQSNAVGFAKRTKSEGYGAYMTYNLVAGDKSVYLSAITQQLYGQATKYK